MKRKAAMKRGTKPLKRTALKRGESQLARSRLKASPARKSGDPSVVAAYLKANPTCEVSGFLRTVLGFTGTWSFGDIDPHHLVGGSGRKDVPENLLAVRRDAHGWIESNPVDGRIVCVWVKWQKQELDVAGYSELFGQSLAAWLARTPPRDERLIPFWNELCAAIQ